MADGVPKAVQGDDLLSIALNSGVKECARCGGDHDALVWHRFIRPPLGFLYWAECPRTGDPLLLEVRST